MNFNGERVPHAVISGGLGGGFTPIDVDSFLEFLEFLLPLSKK